jgi:uncharacterized protein (DUF427 family)
VTSYFWCRSIPTLFLSLLFQLYLEKIATYHADKIITMQRACLTHFSKARLSPLRATSRQQITIRTMAYKASWEGTTIAEAEKSACETVEGNIYFPPSAIKKEFFKESATHTTCGWKGVASYYSVVVDGKENKDAAWYYPDCKEKAKNIEGYVAFWKGVTVKDE